MIVKVCGMRDPENIRALEQLMLRVSPKTASEEEKIHWLMGFIFFPKSPRYVEALPSYLPGNVERTGVFVNETSETVCRYAQRYGLSYLQLHGKESPSQCEELRQTGKVIKVFSIGKEEDLYPVNEYEGCCDLFLFDTKCENYGGSGQQFDWSLLHTYRGKTPFLLSGGMDLGSLPALLDFSHPFLYGYDLNSRFEHSPAVKDLKKLRKFFETLAHPGDESSSSFI